MKRAAHSFPGSLLAAPVPLASAHAGRDLTAPKIAAAFANLAGSEDNALSLVLALQEGHVARLSIAQSRSRAPATVQILSPTGPMGWNDVKMALMLARDALQRYGWSRPGAEHLQAALIGGQVTTPNGKSVAFRGVLAMRAQGMNWGQIAAERYRRPRILSRTRESAECRETIRAD